MNEEFKLRELTADDLFPMFGIISKIGIKELKDCFSTDLIKNAIKDTKASDGAENAEKSVKEVGIQVAFEIADVLFRNLPKCKDDLYSFLSGLSGMSKAEIGKMKPSAFLRLLKEVCKKEEFVDFFQEALRLFN